MRGCYDADIMRTTLNIDDDLLRVARELAAERGESVGTVVSQLMREALTKQERYFERNGLPVFEVREGARALTPEDIRSAEDEV